MTFKAPHHFDRFVFAVTISVTISIAGCSQNSGELADAPNVVPVSPEETPGDVMPNEHDEPSSLVETETPPVAAMSSTDSTPTGNSLYDDALAAMDGGDLDLAFQLVRAAKAEAPDDPETTFLMAHVLAERNRFAEAVKLLDDLADSVPDVRLPVLGQTADWMVVSGQWEKAEQRYRMLLEQVPDASIAERQIARLLLRQGRRQDAAVYLRKLCRDGVVEPSNMVAMLRLALPFGTDASAEDASAEDRSAEDRWAEDRWAEGMDPIGALGIARFKISHGDWQDALETLRGADSDDANQNERIALIGRIHARQIHARQIHARQKDFDALQQWADGIKQPLEANADYWFAMGQLRLSQKRYASALRCFCKTVLIDPTDELAYRLLGQSLDALDRSTNAMKAMERSELIESTHVIGQRFRPDGEIELKDVDQLVELLDRLRRPFESLAWRTIRITLQRSRSEMSENQARQAIAKINEERLQWLQSEQRVADESFVVCGVDLDSLKESDSSIETDE